MRSAAPPLAVRFRERLTGPGGVRGGETLVVALSGGVDSVALLHLLRFTPGLPPLTLVAVHVDHGMRPGSAADAAWAAGLCGAWGIQAEIRRLDRAPASEAAARVARYAVLEDVRERLGADRVLTAHHGDDQAETVLFRALRGTGLRGLRGIAEWRAPRVWRPLLPFDRDDLVAYARRVGLTWREDPTNAGGYARNVLRHQVLPLVERSVAPGARRALRGLARRARDDEAAWRSLEPGILAGLDVREAPDGYSLDRGASLGLHPAVRARVVRGLVRRLGGSLDDTGTRLAVEFTRSGASGGMLPLGGGIWLRRDMGRLGIVRGEGTTPERPVTLPAPGEGRGRAVLGGRVYDVAWDVVWDVAWDVARDVVWDVARDVARDVGSGVVQDVGSASERASRGSHASAASFAADLVAFPLTVRSWRPGDRIRLAYGSKKLKKLFLEARVPAGDRLRLPVLVDAAGSVLWVPGVARSVSGVPSGDATQLQIHIHITHAESD